MMNQGGGKLLNGPKGLPDDGSGGKDVPHSLSGFDARSLVKGSNMAVPLKAEALFDPSITATLSQLLTIIEDVRAGDVCLTLSVEQYLELVEMRKRYSQLLVDCKCYKELGDYEEHIKSVIAVLNFVIGRMEQLNKAVKAYLSIPGAKDSAIRAWVRRKLGF